MTAIRGWAGLSQGAPSYRNILSSSEPRGKLAEAARPVSTQLHPKFAGPTRVFLGRVHPTRFGNLVNQSDRFHGRLAYVWNLYPGGRTPF